MVSKRLFAILCLLLPLLARGEAAVEVKGLRVWPAPDNTRVVFDLGAPVEHTLFTLSSPERIVIDLKDTRLAAPIEGVDYSQGVLKGIRAAVREGGDLRVVLDLKRQVRPKSFVLRPNREYGHRLVIDLEVGDNRPVATRTVPSPDEARDIVIAIDAGHGGEDPGASGPRGTREKNVVLAIARRLQRLVAAEPGMKAVMIRDGDYYVSLRNRIQKARSHQADLFVSIHADAFRDARARGASVYTLSRRGASSEYARLLAEKENAADLVGGVSLDDKDDLLAAVLLDLSQTATMEASTGVASRVLKRLKRLGGVHKGHVEQAGFRVLKAPDVPSILVETAFISNPREERQLRSARHQQALAEAIMDGVRYYFRHNPPPGTRLAVRQRRHVIGRGETLSEIARQYQVSLKRLRELNGMQSSLLKVGDVLHIPPG